MLAVSLLVLFSSCPHTNTHTLSLSLSLSQQKRKDKRKKRSNVVSSLKRTKKRSGSLLIFSIFFRYFFHKWYHAQKTFIKESIQSLIQKVANLTCDVIYWQIFAISSTLGFSLFLNLKQTQNRIFLSFVSCLFCYLKPAQSSDKNVDIKNELDNEAISYHEFNKWLEQWIILFFSFCQKVVRMFQSDKWNKNRNQVSRKKLINKKDLKSKQSSVNYRVAFCFKEGRTS